MSETAAEAARTAAELSALAKAHAYALGFDLAGIAALEPAATADAFGAWLIAGYAGGWARTRTS